MQVTGIVCEFNPFHLGHAYLLSRLRQRGADAIVCAMSGNFVQRGEPALVNKLSRGEMAVSCGVDLVLELPTAWAMTTAETFARGGVQLLKMAGCTHIGFGSECGDAALLQAAADTLLSPDLQADIRSELAAGITYAAARQQAVQARLGDGAAVLRQPNDTLAVEYLKACRQLETDMTPIVVSRVGASHDGGAAEGYASASHIRQLLRQGRGGEALAFLPPGAAEVLLRELAAGRIADGALVERAILARLRQMTEEEFAAYDGGGEGLYHRVYDAVRRCATVEELLLSAEYILAGGNTQVILCERGIRSGLTPARAALDVSAVPVLKRLTHLPGIVDPSHAAGRADLVEPLALAAVAAGADGLMVEVHDRPACALSDGAQALSCDQFDRLAGQVRELLPHACR